MKKVFLIVVLVVCVFCGVVEAADTVVMIDGEIAVHKSDANRLARDIQRKEAELESMRKNLNFIDGAQAGLVVLKKRVIAEAKKEAALEKIKKAEEAKKVKEAGKAADKPGKGKVLEAGKKEGGK